MTADDYLRVKAAWYVAIDAANLREVELTHHPDDQVILDRTSDAADAVLRSIIVTPTTALDEIAARAAVLSSLIDEDINEEDWQGLSARIAADLPNLAASTAASSATDAPTSASEAIRCAA